jgi:hypothetical protein
MKDFINDHKKKYKELKKVFCPYFQKDIEFTAYGFKHLIWKTTFGMRPSEEIRERLDSLIVLSQIVSTSGTLQEVEILENKTFYGFIAIINNKKYKVVVATAKNDRLIFVSIIPKWVTGKRDKIKKSSSG